MVWTKGQSGNPSGRKPGERPKASLAAEALLEGEVEGLTRRCIEAAMAGDMVAMRLCLERILPVRRRNPTPIALPQIEKLPDVANALGVIVDAVSGGTLDIDAGAALAGLVSTKARALETIEVLNFVERIAEVERKPERGSHEISRFAPACSKTSATP